MKVRKHRLTYTQLIALSFLGVILTGAVLLCLPIASKSREWTPFVDAIFTATSATCVTGLVVYDTITHWSIFGQLVLLCLIQIGGLGFMTIMTFLAIFTHKKLGLHKRKLIMQSVGHLQIGGVVTLVRKILVGTLLFEGSGALLLAIRFCPMMGFGKGLYNAVFHSVSAFCNAGFDLMGERFGQFSSFTAFQSDPLVQIVLMSLIVIGGIGFFVWSDISRCGVHFKRYAMHTKLVLCMTAFLIVGGAAGIFIVEYNGALADLSLGNKILASFFQSVTCRTAGFNTIDQTLMHGGVFISIVLMIIGGSPGSTAGGVKTTTFFISMWHTLATVRGEKSITVFKKRISDETVKEAFSIITIYITLVFLATVGILALEPVTFAEALFETGSAIGTVGLSMGITPSLGTVSKIILMLLMYAGRVGGFSFVLAFSREKGVPDIQRPTEKLLVG